MKNIPDIEMLTSCMPAEFQFGNNTTPGKFFNDNKQVLEELLLDLPKPKPKTPNEGLQSTQLVLEKSLNRYLDLYEFIPVTYFSLNEAGFITEIYLTDSDLLGVERQELLKCKFESFIDTSDIDRWHLFFKELLKKNREATVTIDIKND